MTNADKLEEAKYTCQRIRQQFLIDYLRGDISKRKYEKALQRIEEEEKRYND